MFGCSSPEINVYEGKDPKVDIRKLFDGETHAWGLVQDRSGEVKRRFFVKLVGTWNGNEGVLDEDFEYDDGETQKRQWKITVNADGSFTGRAADVVGEARGKQAGFAMNMKYTLELEVAGRTLEIGFDDWIYQLDEKRSMNIAKLKKFGFQVGQVVLYFEKQA